MRRDPITTPRGFPAPDSGGPLPDYTGHCAAIVEAESVVVRCRKCGAHLEDSRDMLVWVAAVLAHEIGKRRARECKKCGTFNMLPRDMPTTVPVQAP